MRFQPGDWVRDSANRLMLVIRYVSSRVVKYWRIGICMVALVLGHEDDLRREDDLKDSSPPRPFEVIDSVVPGTTSPAPHGPSIGLPRLSGINVQHCCAVQAGGVLVTHVGGVGVNPGSCEPSRADSVAIGNINIRRKPAW